MRSTCFNSMMVRLQPSCVAIDKADQPVFQFHDGTITTKTNSEKVSAALEFQFHDGTITTQYYLQ